MEELFYKNIIRTLNYLNIGKEIVMVFVLINNFRNKN